MTKLTKFDKAACRMIGEEMTAALQAVADKYGLTVRAGGGSFEAGEYAAKAIFKIADTGAAEAIARETFSRNCRLFDLVAADFGVEFGSRSERYVLTGLELRRSKFPIRARRLSDGKEILLTEMAVPLIQAARAAA